MLTLENEPVFPYRIARATDGSGDFYVTDGKVGSVFFYDSGMVLKAEIKGLDTPLGIAVDSLGYILVGNDGRDNIEVYNPANGNLLATFGGGLVQMPNAITIGPGGEIYVTDSRRSSILVFDADYNYLRSIGSPGEGESELNFPMDSQIIARNDGGTTVYDVFVADQGNNRIQIFDTDGNILETMPPPPNNCGWFGPCDAPAFLRLQALSTDPAGQLHVLDTFDAKVHILNANTGELVSSYGGFGEEPGFLRVPKDVLNVGNDQSVVTSGNGNRVEVLTFP
jgi:DNA-binding beta-propeller fold protein YncE